MLLNKIFYTLKPVIPRSLQILVRRRVALYKVKKYRDIWPIDPEAGNPPDEWKGWPNGKRFAFVLSHDVDTQKGHDNVLKLVEIEERLGFRSSFNFVPERYEVSEELLKNLKKRGFEVGVHGLKHDGKLFFSKKIFDNRAVKINRYLKNWGANGFRSPAMHRNFEWIHTLGVLYDLSSFDTDPFEPQSKGVRTIYPFIVTKNNPSKQYVELPYTLVQDFTIFVLMNKKNINIWKDKLEWIAKKGGMALVNIHPDYINFGGDAIAAEEYPVELYVEFLKHAKQKYNQTMWHALPIDVARFARWTYRA